MVFSTVLKAKMDKHVGMGQIVLASGPTHLTAVLGSCIAVTMHAPKHETGVLAHVILAQSSGRNSPPGKFADTAVPEMIRMMEAAGAARDDIVARLAGGANIFGRPGPLQIGNANIEAITQILKQAGIPIKAEDIGGTKGRRVSFDCQTGSLTIEMAGSPARVLR
ncbi:MAG TPA: chemotaxis protein CheD [Thermoguttaceae bacterium]|nr:chemotaxis protein CheD [Thermoguttaceae bacterium]